MFRLNAKLAVGHGAVPPVAKFSLFALLVFYIAGLWDFGAGIALPLVHWYVGNICGVKNGDFDEKDGFCGAT